MEKKLGKNPERIHHTVSRIIRKIIQLVILEEISLGIMEEITDGMSKKVPEGIAMNSQERSQENHVNFCREAQGGVGVSSPSLPYI